MFGRRRLAFMISLSLLTILNLWSSSELAREQSASVGGSSV